MVDRRTGRFVNANLGEYRIPTHADVPAMQAILVEERDPFVNALGVKGVGEIGVTGTAGAIANAVWHATGDAGAEVSDKGGGAAISVCRGGIAMKTKPAPGEKAWTDPDDAPRLTKSFFVRAEIRDNEKILRPAPRQKPRRP